MKELPTRISARQTLLVGVLVLTLEERATQASEGIACRLFWTTTVKLKHIDSESNNTIVSYCFGTYNVRTTTGLQFGTVPRHSLSQCEVRTCGVRYRPGFAPKTIAKVEISARPTQHINTSAPRCIVRPIGVRTVVA